MLKKEPFPSENALIYNENILSGGPHSIANNRPQQQTAGTQKEQVTC